METFLIKNRQQAAEEFRFKKNFYVCEVEWISFRMVNLHIWDRRVLFRHFVMISWRVQEAMADKFPAKLS